MATSRAVQMIFAGLAALAISTSIQAQQVAFTWDDVPAHSAMPPGESRVAIGRALIHAMKEARLPPAYGFVNGASIEREPASEPMLKEWRDAGFPLGNHSWSHMNLNTASLEDWEADVLKNEPILEKYAGNSDWHWLRYPYLAEGDSPEKRVEARKFLAAHGYRIAAVTMSFADYMWNEPYARCVAKNDTAGMEQLEISYLDAASNDVDYRRAMAKALFGHDIPYVLLMHVGAFDAHMLPHLLGLYQNKGIAFVTLDEAEKDPFYLTSLDPSQAAGPDLLEAAMEARGLPLPQSPKLTLDVNGVCR